MYRIFVLLLFAVLAIQPLHASFRISEFLAENDGFWRDEDGDTPDWIEIHNDGLTAANLAGWHLTDDPLDLTKWTFPSTVVGDNQYLVVFASNKDRRISGEELHTNFQLR